MFLRPSSISVKFVSSSSKNSHMSVSNPRLGTFRVQSPSTLVLKALGPTWSIQPQAQASHGHFLVEAVTAPSIKRTMCSSKDGSISTEHVLVLVSFRASRDFSGTGKTSTIFFFVVKTSSWKSLKTATFSSSFKANSKCLRPLCRAFQFLQQRLASSEALKLLPLFHRWAWWSFLEVEIFLSYGALPLLIDLGRKDFYS